MEPTTIYNNLNEKHSEFLMDETMDLVIDHDVSTENKEIAEKLVDKVKPEINFEEMCFTEEEFDQNKAEVASIFAEMLLEMNEF